MSSLSTLQNWITEVAQTACFWTVGGNQSTQRKPTQTQTEHANSMGRSNWIFLVWSVSLNPYAAMQSKDGYSCWQEGFLVASMLQQIWRSLWLKTLLLNHCVVKRMFRMVHDVFIFWSILLCTISPRGSRTVSITETSFFISLSSFLSHWPWCCFPNRWL